jgi:transposase
LRKLWTQPHEVAAYKFFQRWYQWAAKSGLQAVKRVADMIRERVDRVVRYCSLRITNDVAEGLNSKIKTIKRRACGYRNAEHFNTVIFFYCGGLDLYPSSPATHRNP